MVVRGYVLPMRQRSGALFEESTIDRIFSNIENIHKLNQTFLQALRESAARDAVGQCFVDYAERFQIYSRYCNNHTRVRSRGWGVGMCRVSGQTHFAIVCFRHFPLHSPIFTHTTLRHSHIVFHFPGVLTRFPRHALPFF